MLEILNFQNANVAIFLIIYTEHFNVFAHMTSVSMIWAYQPLVGLCAYILQIKMKLNSILAGMFIVSSLVYNQKLIISILWKKKFSLQHIILSIYLSWRTSCHCAEYWIYWKYGAKSCVWPTMKLDLFSLSWMLYPQPLVLFSLYVY